MMVPRNIIFASDSRMARDPCDVVRKNDLRDGNND